MRRALFRLATVAWAVAAGVVGVTATVASADAPQEQGWWTVTNPGGLPANPASAIADVPSDGLLVQSGPVDPTSPCNCTAYAGLVYEIGDGLTASDLTLKVASNSGTTPVATLELCPLVNPTLDAEQGGPLSDAPDYDCKQHESASLGAGDSSFTFHVKSLVSDGILGVAILPGDSTSRVVLSKPDSSSLATTASPSPAGAAYSGPSVAPTPVANSGGGTTSGGVNAGGGGAVQAPPQLPQQAAVSGADAGQAPQIASPPSSPAPAPTLAAAPVASTSSANNASTPVAVIILVAGLAVGAALWALAGRDPAGGVAEV